MVKTLCYPGHDLGVTNSSSSHRVLRWIVKSFKVISVHRARKINSKIPAAFVNPKAVGKLRVAVLMTTKFNGPLVAFVVAEELNGASRQVEALHAPTGI